MKPPHRYRRRTQRVALAALATLALIGAARAEPAEPPPLLLVREATELSVTGRGPWVIEVARRLWRLPTAGGPAEPLTPAGQWARRPQQSPDGARLVYQALVAGAFQIAISNADGSEPRIVTSGPFHHLTPAWSPDGSSLAFAANRTGRFQIWLLEVTSGELRLVSSGSEQHYDPAWDAARGRLAWVSEAPGRFGLHAARPGETPQQLLTSSLPLRAPAWRPDGRVIAYTALTPQGPRLQLAILSRPVVVKPLAAGESAAMSPPVWLDDRHLLYGADGQLRRREIGANLSEPIGFEVALERPPATRRVPRISLPEPATPAAPLLVRAARVLNAAGDGWLLDHELLVEGGRIRAIGQRGTLALPAGVTTIDTGAGAVLPGLLDLTLEIPVGSSDTLGATLLGYGITTAQLRAGFGPTALDMAGRWQRFASGPRVLAGTTWCGGTLPAGNTGILTPGVLQVCAAASDPATLAAAPQSIERPLWSAVGLAASSGLAHAIEYPGMGLRVPLAEAQAGNTLWLQDALDQVLAAGVPVIANPDAAWPAVFEFAPDLLDSRQVRALCGDGPCPAAVAWSLAGPAARAALRDQRRVLGRFVAGGGTIVAVSDSPETPFGLGLHAELRLLESAGVPRTAVLAAATRAAAAAAGLDADVGSLAPGKLGDLLIVAGDPLADLRALLAIEQVIVAGRPMQPAGPR